MTAIAFVEVEPEDTALVKGAFPDALALPGVVQDPATLAACAGAEALCCFVRSRVGEEQLAALPKLKILCTRSVGVDHVDLAACARRGIVVCNVPDYGSHVIAEHAFALLLSAARRVPEGAARTRAGGFSASGLRGTALKGKTLGIVGTGKIGAHAARIGHGFGMRLLAFDIVTVPTLESELGLRYVPMDQLLAESDVVSLHVPSTPRTRHLLGRDAFARMKPGAILVNTARGAVVDGEALLEALDAGRLAWALLDVLEHETDVASDNRLLSHPKVLATPHVAFYTAESVGEMYAQSFASIRTWSEGATPEHAVTS